ncbi:MAG: hypothetical protein AB1634_02650 [Thermodesulfobacteriota bacterium]
MPNISIRGIDAETDRLLRQAANRRGKSVNAQVIELIRQGLGVGNSAKGITLHTDLDHLAGTWSQEDADEFSARITTLSEVDETLWR